MEPDTKAIENSVDPDQLRGQLIRMMRIHTIFPQHMYEFIKHIP